MNPGNKLSGCPDGTGNPEPKSLAGLLAGLSYSTLTATQPEQVTITSVTADSRQARAGALFVALVGTKTDGHKFALQAISKGCSAILIEEGKCGTAEFADTTLCIAAVKDSRLAYAAVAANFYNHPARELIFIGITGTNGKTTITYLLEHIFEQLGLPVGVIGTVNYRYSKIGRAHV
jgi:UDP-N-acetylmuramyl tripeptide synthase